MWTSFHLIVRSLFEPHASNWRVCAESGHVRRTVSENANLRWQVTRCPPAAFTAEAAVCSADMSSVGAACVCARSLVHGGLGQSSDGRVYIALWLLVRGSPELWPALAQPARNEAAKWKHVALSPAATTTYTTATAVHTTGACQVMRYAHTHKTQHDTAHTATSVQCRWQSTTLLASAHAGQHRHHTDANITRARLHTHSAVAACLCCHT